MKRDNGKEWSMNPNDQTLFVWYAVHPRDGDLILVIPELEHYRYCYIYSPRIIHERLRHKMDPVLALELNVGPIGYVPRCLYEEAGFMVETPLEFRLLALEDEAKTLTEERMQAHDSALKKFILGAWNSAKKFTK